MNIVVRILDNNGEIHQITAKSFERVYEEMGTIERYIEKQPNQNIL